MRGEMGAFSLAWGLLLWVWQWNKAAFLLWKIPHRSLSLQALRTLIQFHVHCCQQHLLSPWASGEMPLFPELSLTSRGDSIRLCSWPLRVFVQGPAAVTSPGAPPPDLLNQSLHFNKTRRWFVCSGKIEQHAADSLVLAPSVGPSPSLSLWN